MSDLTKAIETYINRRKIKSTIPGFLSNDENNKELLMVWFEVYDKYEDALKAFVTRFKQIYKAQVNKSQNAVMTNGRRVLNEATNVVSQRLILKLTRPPTTPSSTFLSASVSSTPIAATTSSSNHTSPAPSLTYSASAASADSTDAVVLSSVKDRLNSYISKCISEGKKHGFNLQTQVHEVSASKNIILLRKGQQCQKLIEQVDVVSLLEKTKSEALNKEIVVDINVYLKLATILRGFNEIIDRRTMKIQLDQLYAEANEEDGAIVEIFSKLVQKLPNQERLSHVGEMELIVNFLDPILSPICHCPDKNKLLVWLIQA